MMIFVCHGDFEQAWIDSLCADDERRWQEYERDEDRDAEHALGLEALLDAESDGCDPDDYLPEYAPRSYEIQLPEVFQT